MNPSLLRHSRANSRADSFLQIGVVPSIGEAKLNSKQHRRMGKIIGFTEAFTTTNPLAKVFGPYHAATSWIDCREDKCGFMQHFTHLNRIHERSIHLKTFSSLGMDMK